MEHSSVNIVDILKFRGEHQKAYGSEECYVDGRYMVWLCDVLFEEQVKGDENNKGRSVMEENSMLHLLDRWQDSIVKLLASEGECMWKLLLQNLGVASNVLNSAAGEYVNSFKNRNRDIDPLGVYFQWPSFLRNTILPIIQQENNSMEQDSNKRRKSNDGSAISLRNYQYYKPISLSQSMDSKLQYEQNAWLPVLGYVITHAFLSCRDDKETTILESMDDVQSMLVLTLPKSLGLDLEKRHALLSGVAAYLIDALGEGLAEGVSSLGEDENDDVHENSIMNGNGGVKSILGAEVAQIVDLLCCQGVLPMLAKYTNTPLAGLVSETANSLLNYSQVYHQIHHETSLSADDEIVAQLRAKDALKVIQFVNKTNPQLKRELTVRKFTKQTCNSTDDDPRKHPIVTYLRALLETGNLSEGSKLCRTLESCSGLVKEVERCCWYSLFDKMQEIQVLYEHHWDKGESRLVPILDYNGKVSMRRNGIVTLANISIGPFGRSVALEYLNTLVETSKEELVSNSFNSVKSKEQIDCNKDQFRAIKDAVRRTVIKFLLPRPNSPAEALRIANRIAEADKPPLLKYHTNPAQGQNASDLCIKILEQPSLSIMWEEKVALEEQQMLAAAQEAVQQIVQPAEMPQKEQAEDGPLDMSMELIPATPAKTPPDISPPTADDGEDVIELGDSDDEQIDDQNEEQSHEKVDIEYTSDGIEEEEKPECLDESMTKSLESSSHVDDLEKEERREEYYDSNEECSQEDEINYPPNYHQYQGNYSESDDYEQEDDEEANRRVAFEGQYDAEEGRGTRGNSSSDGSVEVFDLMSTDDEQENANDEAPCAEVINESSTEEEHDEYAVLNDAVDNYIGVSSQSSQVQESSDTNDRQILHEKVHEYIPVSSPLKMTPERDDTNSAIDEMLVSAEAPTSEGEDILNKKHEVASEKEADETLATAGAVVKEVDGASEKGMAAPEEDQKPNILGAGDALYSSNVGEDLSEDMNADDEHESLDTEDDKRSLEEHEQGETNDEEEAGNAAGTSSRVYSNNSNEDPDKLTKIDQPSILVAAARDAAAAPDTSMATDSILAETREQDLTPSYNEDAHFMDSDVEVQEGGQFTDDGYVPDAEAAEEDKVEKKKRAIDDGYVPDAEATEEETTKPIGFGVKAVKKRDVRFEAVLDMEETPPMMPLPVEPATTNHSIDEGYIPDGALTEEEKRDRQERRSRSIEAGYSPDGHTTATDDDTTAVLPSERHEVIDPGYLPSAVEGGTEEERSEEESQAAIPSVLVATALVTQSGQQGASDIANRASLATATIAKPLSTQSIDDGYLPESTFEFDEEERRNLRKETRSHEVEAGYLPDGHTTPGDVTEEDQPKESKSKLLIDAKLKLSESVSIADSVRMPPPPHNDAATHSTDDGYLASAADDDTAVEPNHEKETCIDQKSQVQEDRSEGEDVIAEVSVGTKVDSNTGISHNAVAVDVIEKNSNADDDGAVAAEQKDTDNIAGKDEILGTNDLTVKHDAPSIEMNSNADDDGAVAAEQKDTDNITGKDEIPGTNDSTVKHDAPSIENVSSTNYDLNDQGEQSEPGKHTQEESTLPEKTEAITTQAKGRGSQKKRSSTRKRALDETESVVDIESVQSETSSVRRSSRLRSKKAASSQAVPTSITTGGRGKKAPTLPAVPEDEKFDAAEPVKAEVLDHSITRSTRRRGKKSAGDDDESHASSVNDESSKTTAQSKRSRASQVSEPTRKNTRGGKRKKQTEEEEANSIQSEDKTSPNKSSGKEKGSEEILDSMSESVSSSPAKARSRRARKRDVVVDAPEAVSALGDESPPKRRGRTRKTQVAQEAESTVSSTTTRASRRTRRTAKDDNESIKSSPPRTRSKKTNVPSQTESLASTRPRRSRKATKKPDL
eukprot:scaffold284863_cov93-Cyclotella_meneghiniana.AAC.5